MADQTNSTIIANVDAGNTGQEVIHLRNFSTDNVVRDVAIQLLPLTSAARSAPPRARRRAARRRSSVGGRVPVLRAAAACALWLVGLV